MKEFKGKVAVIAGAATGIGRALAEHCAKEGMKVVLVDTYRNGLAQLEKDLKAAGAPVLAVETDVSNLEEAEALAEKTLDKFGTVDLLCNAASVHCPKPLSEATLADWKWLTAVNLWGPIHTVSVFLPIMHKQDTECHIVFVAPVLGGFCPLPFNGPYNVTEFGVVNFAETLSLELAARRPKIGVSLLSPDYADASILNSERHRPAELRNPATKEMGVEDIPHLDEIKELIRATAQAETSPGRLAEIVFDAIRENKFYVFPHPSSKVIMRERFAHIDAQSNPVNVLQLMGVAG